MRLDAGLPQSVVYDFCFWYFVGCLVGYNEFTDALVEVADLNPNVPEKIISGPSTNDNDSV